MAQADWTELTDSLATSSLARGVSSGFTPPNGGGSFVYAVNSRTTSVGGWGLFCNLTNFAPMAKGGTISMCLQRALSGGGANFSPFLFMGLQGSTVNDNGYLLGLADEEPHHISLVKGKVINGVIAGGAGALGVLRRSTATYSTGTWLHLRLDMIVNLSGDVILKCYKNDLALHSVLEPTWEAIGGMTDFVDDVAGINSANAGVALLPFTSGRGGWGFSTKDVSRRALYDHISLSRQLL